MNFKNDLNKEIERISAPDSLFENIEAAKGVTYKFDKRDKIIHRRIRQKKVIVSLAFILGIFLTMNITTYAFSGKNVIGFFFDKNEFVDEELLDYCGESYELDGYVFTLESSLYDSTTGIGYALLSIKNMTGKTEGKVFNLTKELYSDGIGPDGRFSVSINANRSIYYQKEDNTIYVYWKFIHSFVEGDRCLISIEDNKNVYSGQADEPAIYEITLPETTNVMEIDLEDGSTLRLCSLGGAIISENDIDSNYVKITMMDGEEVIFDEINEINIKGSCLSYIQDEKGNRKTEKIFLFEKAIDINKIKDVEVRNN